MPRDGKTITFTLPPDLALKFEEIRRAQGKSNSEIVREAVRQYIAEREWQDVLNYGERTARAQGIAEGDVERLIDEYRSEST